jgi:hypothetical protein
MAACIGGELIANRAPGLGVDRPPNAGSGRANPCGQSDRRKFGLREACRCVHARRVCAALVGSAVVLDLVLSPRRGQARGDPGGTDNMKQCLPCPGSRAESSPRTIFQLAPFEPRNRPSRRQHRFESGRGRQENQRLSSPLPASITHRTEYLRNRRSWTPVNGALHTAVARPPRGRARAQEHPAQPTPRIALPDVLGQGPRTASRGPAPPLPTQTLARARASIPFA